jgi:hypothetical protein
VATFVSFVRYSFLFFPSIPLHLGLSPNEKLLPPPFLFPLFPTLRLHISVVAFVRRFYQHQRWSFFVTMGSVHISNDWE